MARLALILHLIELFAEAGHLGSELFGIDAAPDSPRMLHDHAEVIRQDGASSSVILNCGMRKVSVGRRVWGFFRNSAIHFSARGFLRWSDRAPGAAVAVEPMADIAFVALEELRRTPRPDGTAGGRREESEPSMRRGGFSRHAQERRGEGVQIAGCKEYCGMRAATFTETGVR